jgi:hypothetical protein
VQPNETTSPETVVPDIVAVVAVDAVVCCLSAGVVRSFAKQVQPVGAVAERPIVITTVQVPVVPLVYVPTVDCPTSVELAHPDAVKVVPKGMKAADRMKKLCAAVPQLFVESSIVMTPAALRQIPTSSAPFAAPDVMKYAAPEFKSRFALNRATSVVPEE